MNDKLELTVSDDGIGLPEDLDFRNTQSLGLDLVMMLAEDQLEGKIELNREGGTTYYIQFKMREDKVSLYHSVKSKSQNLNPSLPMSRCPLWRDSVLSERGNHT